VRLFGRRDHFREMDEAKALEPVNVKGVTIDHSESHDDNWGRNLVSIRTVTSESLTIGSYGLMYRRQPAVRSVVDFLAINIAQLNPKVYERVDDNDRKDVTQHPLALLLQYPNPATTRFTHIRDTVSDLGIYDRAYWRKLRLRGRVAGVVRLPPEHVLVDTSTGVKVYKDPHGVEIPRRDLVIFSGYNPDSYADGVSPLETLRQVLQEETASIAHRESMWQNAARQSGVIERPLEAPEWSDLARQSFRAAWQETYGGTRNAGKTVVLEEGMKWNAASFSPEQTQYIDSRKLTYEEVALTYFGPVAGRSFLQATGTGTEATHNQVYQDVLAPRLEHIEGEIELQLLPDFEPFSERGRIYVEFNIAAKLKGSFQEQAESLTTAVGVPYMAVNEGRARLNLPQIDAEWADQPVQPLNVMYGGQPAVTVPVEEEPGLAAAPAPSAKDLARLEQAVADHAKALRSHYDRMERTVVAAKAIDTDRWDRELTADLYIEAQPIAKAAGIDQLTALTALAEIGRKYAEKANTSVTVAEADTADDIHAAFDEARTQADRLAEALVTDLVNYAATASPPERSIA
jgi:HK97 family phage portal protein